MQFYCTSIIRITDETLAFRSAFAALTQMHGYSEFFAETYLCEKHENIVSAIMRPLLAPGFDVKSDSVKRASGQLTYEHETVSYISNTDAAIISAHRRLIDRCGYTDSEANDLLMPDGEPNANAVFPVLLLPYGSTDGIQIINTDVSYH